ncbi:unnamed protein product [Arabis nemorensis]|uniref:Large ribosomal subunit protein uL4 C-terminal domain-containing protein n=1 Tax=Arabis nemorensis TaxID=586526 RepID=A0A565C9E3_9BRAS|nr:unnamed protein product [Arabis nemorensis]
MFAPTKRWRRWHRPVNIGAYADAEKAKDSIGIRPGKDLSLRKLAPGGHLGRLVIWTKSAFEKLESVYGSFEKPSEMKKGYVLPRPKMVNADLARIIHSDEVQNVVRPIKKDLSRAVMKNVGVGFHPLNVSVQILTKLRLLPPKII